jgi:hypothetical protein
MCSLERTLTLVQLVPYFMLSPTYVLDKLLNETLFQHEMCCFKDFQAQFTLNNPNVLNFAFLVTKKPSFNWKYQTNIFPYQVCHGLKDNATKFKHLPCTLFKDPSVQLKKSILIQTFYFSLKYLDEMWNVSNFA